MKIFKSRYGLMAAAAMLLTFTGCRNNDLPEFNDADAFVAFTSASFGVSETSGTLEIPVLLTSLSGLEATVEFTLTPDSAAGAVEGVNYTLANSSKTLTFTKDAPTQVISLNIIDNDTFDGNVKFTIELVAPEGLNLGASKQCVVSIQDNEHPLAFILGDYAGSADSYFSSRGHFDWTISVDRDESDVNKVWISNLDPYFGKNGKVAPDCNLFYGFVNDEKTEIRVPVGQEMGYEKTFLVAFTGDDPKSSDMLDSDGNLIIEILNDGKQLRLPNAWGIYDDGFWNLFYGGITFTQQ